MFFKRPLVEKEGNCNNFYAWPHIRQKNLKSDLDGKPHYQVAYRTYPTYLLTNHSSPITQLINHNS
jgi:hypothetical protein